MIDAVVEFIHQSLGAELAVLVAAVFPVIEVRGAVPLGIALGLEPLQALLVSLVGSMLPVPLLLLAVRRLFNCLSRFPLCRDVVDRITTRTLAKSRRVQQYGLWGLVLYVGVPLPGTGVWTGSLIAVLLGLPLKGALFALFVGDLIAALAVAMVVQGVVTLF